jgi:hypothetical protein
MVNAAVRAGASARAAERVGIDQQQRFDAGIELGDAGIGDVVEGDAEPRQEEAKRYSRRNCASVLPWGTS